MYERFEELRRLLGFSVAEVCRETGIAKSTMSDWKKGKFRLKDDKRKLIANLFGVSLAVLDAEEPIPFEIIPGAYRQGVPSFDLSAGEGRINGDYAQEYVEYGGDSGASGEFYYCTIHGDSMYPTLHDGDRVKVRMQTETTPQDIAVVKIDNETVTAKHVEIVGNGIWLRAENESVFKDRFYSVQDVMTLPVTIIGVVVQLQRDI
jgi:repressor LexA